MLALRAQGPTYKRLKKNVPSFFHVELQDADFLCEPYYHIFRYVVYMCCASWWKPTYVELMSFISYKYIP